MASILDALRIIKDELPKFFTETNTPFLGKDEEGSVMKEKSAGQKEKEINESLLKLGAAAPALLKGVGMAMSSPKLTATAAAIGTGDPTMLLPGGAGLLAQSNDAEAMVVPARLVHSSDEISKALGLLRKGENPLSVYNAGKKGEDYGGVYLGAKDNKIKSVISDEGAKLTGVKEGTLGEVMDHPLLYKHMPELKDIKVKMLPEGTRANLRGSMNLNTNELEYNRNMNVDDLMNTILHETQHAVQKSAGFTPGSSQAAEMMGENFAKAYDQEAAVYKNRGDRAPKELFNDILGQIYQKGAGEVEARTTEAMKQHKVYTAYPLHPRLVDTPVDEWLMPTSR